MTGWAERAAAAERAVRGRHLRRLLGLPGTALGVVGWPPSASDRAFWRWHYWWQAHLLDCLVDAQLRAPAAARLDLIGRQVRGHRLRNGGRWGNAYFDDMAWFALALLRARAVTGRRWGSSVELLTGRITDAWSDRAGGGIPWRRGDEFRNTPANGPAAILLARIGNLVRAEQTVEWIDARLLLPGTGLIADGWRPGDVVEDAVYSYGQGVVLGAELELIRRTGRDPGRLHRLVAAVDTHLAPGGVLAGHGGGNGGLFTGILARYLAQVAQTLPGDDAAARRTRGLAAGLVTRSAAALWAGRADADGGPVFAADWSARAVVPDRTGRAGRVVGNAMVASSDTPERDLSVQLAGWMLLEAAHVVAG